MSTAPSTSLRTPLRGGEVFLVDSPEGVERLRDFWQSLVWHPYTDIDYYLAELQADTSVVRPHILVLQEGGTPRTLVIGKVFDAGLRIQFGYRTLFNPNLRILSIQSRGILGDTPSDTCEAIMDALLAQLASGKFDVVKLMGLPIHSPLFSVARTQASAWIRDPLPAVAPAWQLELVQDYTYFLHSHPNLKRHIRKHAKRIQKTFGHSFRFQSYGREEDLDRLLGDMERVAAKTWQRGLGVGFVNDVSTRAIFRLALARGWLRVYLHYIGTTPVSFLYGLQYGERFVAQEKGYDPAYSDYGVGTLTLLKVIEEMYREPEVTWMDFGPGNAEDKRRYCNHSRLEADMLIFAPTPRCIAINILRSTVALAHRQVKTLLRRTGWEGAAKRLWRERVARQIFSDS